jgi:hypothetical protein
MQVGVTKSQDEEDEGRRSFLMIDDDDDDDDDANNNNNNNNNNNSRLLQFRVNGQVANDKQHNIHITSHNKQNTKETNRNKTNRIILM